MQTLKQLLSQPVRNEVILMFQRDGEDLEMGLPVPSWKTFTLDDQGPDREAAIVSNHDGRFVSFDPETKVREADLKGPYEGVTTYIMLLDVPEPERAGRLLWPRFKQHIKENPMVGSSRWLDLNSKINDLRHDLSAKNIADVIMSVAMLAEMEGINPDLAVWNRNRELLERMIATGSPLNPNKH